MRCIFRIFSTCIILCCAPIGAFAASGNSLITAYTNNIRFFIVAEDYASVQSGTDAALSYCKSQRLSNCTHVKDYFANCIAIIIDTPSGVFAAGFGPTVDEAANSARFDAYEKKMFTYSPDFTKCSSSTHRPDVSILGSVTLPLYRNLDVPPKPRDRSNDFSRIFKTLFPDYDPETVITICACVALSLFVVLQLRQFVRVGRHRFVEIPKSLAIAVVATITIASFYFWAVYFIPRLYYFLLALTRPAQLLIALAVFSTILFLLPHRFWLALQAKLNRLRTPTFAQPPRQKSSLQAQDPPAESSNSAEMYEPSQGDQTPAASVHTADAANEIKLPAVVPEVTQAQPTIPPLQTMALKLKRSQKQGLSGAIIYILDARMDVPADTRDHIRKHRLGGRLVYESEARQKHRANAIGRAAASADAASGVGFIPTPGKVGKGLLKTAWNLGRAGVSAARASLALRITVDSLIAGVHVECKSMEELLEAEDAIRQAAENLKGYVEVGKTFDGGEEVVEL
jgi:hypothetical protein